MTDNIFDLETSALAQYACLTRDPGILMTDFACAYASETHSWIVNVLDKAELPLLISQLLRMFCSNKHDRGRIRRQNQRTLSHGKRCKTRMSYQLCPVRGLRPHLSLALQCSLFLGTLPSPTLHRALMLTILLSQPRHFVL